MSDSEIYDSDFEDASDVSESLYGDSPADGYFSQRDHPPETFVEQSSVQADSEVKAREAAEGPVDGSPATPPSHTSPTTSTRSPIWVVEGTALLDAGPAPPDYAAATAGRPRTTQTHERSSTTERSEAAAPRSYGSIENATQEPQPTQRTRDTPPTAEQVEPQWPFGNRGNPFGAQFPYGSQGNPFGPNFPFGPNSPFGPNGNSNGTPAQTLPPQSMQDGAAAEETADEETGLISRKRRKHSKAQWKRLRRCCRPSAALNYLLVVIVVGLIVLILRVMRETSGKGVPPSGGGEPRLPVEDGGDDSGEKPVTGSPNNTLPTHPRNSKCAYNVFSEPVSFGFDDPENFSFTELLEPTTYMSGTISGTIYILSAPADQDVAIRVWVSFATPEPWHVTNVNYEFAQDSLALRLPKVEKAHSGYAGAACLDIVVGVYVKDDVELGDWAMTTANLDIEVEDGRLFGSKSDVASDGLRLTNTTTINAVKGHVNMAYWSSRETRIEAVSGSVHGTYALRDLLSIRSHSGSIGVTVLPKEADEEKPAPAEFIAISHSGSVHVRFPMQEHSIPDRDYKTRVESHSSSLSGTYIHGSATSFHTSSGTIHADILPYAHSTTSSNDFAVDAVGFRSYDPSTLLTENSSGSTTITLLSPVNDSEPGKYTEGVYTGVLSRLHSSHKSSSGSLNVIYPQEWEGTIEGWTNSGSVNVKGKDVQTYFGGSVGLTNNHLVARKGLGSSRLDFRTTSGSVRLTVGDS